MEKVSAQCARTSCSSAGVKWQAGGSSPQNLLLGFWPFLLLVTLLLSLSQAELEGAQNQKQDILDYRPEQHRRVTWVSHATSLEGLAGFVKMVFQ